MPKLNLSKKIAPLFLASAIAYVSYVGSLEGYLQRGIGLISDKYKNISIEQIIKKDNSFSDAKDYLLTHMSYSSDDRNYGQEFEAPFNLSHQSGKGDCDDGAIVAATLLKDNPNYLIQKMNLYTKSNGLVNMLEDVGLFENHVVALVLDKKTNQYGSLGINPCDNIKPKYDSPEEVFKKLNQSFFWSFNNYELENYDKESLIYGIHPVDESIKRHDLENKLNSGKSTLFLAYAPKYTDSENQKFVFIDGSKTHAFDYKNLENWHNLFNKNEKLTESEFFSLTNGDLSVNYIDDKVLSETQWFNVYSE